jgi:putative SOS response-associated peptidase YedK
MPLMLLKAVGYHFGVDDTADLLERHPTRFSPVDAARNPSPLTGARRPRDAPRPVCARAESFLSTPDWARVHVRHRVVCPVDQHAVVPTQRRRCNSRGVIVDR